MWWSLYVDVSTPTFVAGGEDGAVVVSVFETLKAVSDGS